MLRLPLNRHCSRDVDEDSFSFQDAKAELTDIITKSNATAKASKELLQGGKARKQQWWAERRELDQRLQELLVNMEYCWLGGFRGILCDSRFDRDLLGKFHTSFLSVLAKHLPTRRSARTRSGAAKTKSTEVKVDPRVLELFLRVGEPDLSDNSELLEDLIYFVLDILQFHGECNAYDELDMDQITVDIQEVIHMYYNSLDEDYKLDHLVLILDQTVQMFPWESLPCLRGKSVSRLPSLALLRELLVTQSSGQDAELRSISSLNGAYVLNPSADLVNTQTMFSSKLKNLTGWNCVVERPPAEEELKEMLETKEILLYFGHGGGEQYIRASSVKNLKQCAATFLLGCSSGLLHDSGEFEPWGTPLNYLIGGCPMLVANLWDVTDKDIDKFSDDMLQKWGLYGEVSDDSDSGCEFKGVHLGAAIASSRDSCILKYLNGAAPVIYGIPLHLS